MLYGFVVDGLEVIADIECCPEDIEHSDSKELWIEELVLWLEPEHYLEVDFAQLKSLG